MYKVLISFIKKGVKLKVYRRINAIILCFLSLIFFSQLAFAQGLDALKSDIYSKLKCCSCKEAFEKCTCPEAKEMRAYIDALLESAGSNDDIFYKIAKKFSLNTVIDAKIRQDVERRLIKEAGDKYPKIILTPDYFDFGQVTRKQGKLSKEFNLTNRGNAILIIKNIRTSCPCASVSLNANKNKSLYFGTAGAPKDWQVAINPGESGILELSVDLASPYVKAGKMIRDASVISNDIIYPEILVRVEAEVKD